MIVVDCAAVVDALTAVDGTDALRAFLAGEELSAPVLLDLALDCPVLTRDVRLARSSGHLVSIEVR